MLGEWGFRRLVLKTDAGLGYPVKGGAALQPPAGKPIPVKGPWSIAHPLDFVAAKSWHELQADCFRRERVQPFKRVRVPAQGGQPVCGQCPGFERPEQPYQRREGLRTVVAAVSALPKRQRDALVLRELEGRSYDEIARELGISDGAVRQLLNRARTTLRQPHGP